MNLLVGKRAVYTRIEKKYDEEKREHVEVSRKLFRGTIAALVTTSEYSYPSVVMLWGDGTLTSHSISDITIEAEPTGYRDAGKPREEA